MTAGSHTYNFGSYNQVTVLYEASDKDFFSPPLDQFRPPRFPKLQHTEGMVELLRKQRLLLLVSDPTVSILPLARHFAWYLSDLLSHEKSPGSSPASIPVLEWKGSSGQIIDRWIEQYPDQTIFILPQLLPQHLNHDIRKLWRALSDRHYAIVTVEEKTLWQQSQEDRILRPFWRYLHAADIYTPRDLVPFLANRLKEASSQLPGALSKDPAGKGVLLGGCQIEKVAEDLKTPENIEDFVRQLCEAAQNSRITSHMVAECIKVAQDDTSRLREWYFKLPSIREQLLVLALNFFDGLADIQFFAAVDELIEQAWYRRETSLRSLDFCDLEPLEKFYDSVPLKGGGEAIKTRLQDQRRRLFEVVWKRHRRHILAALPVFYRCIQQSVEANTGNMTLYGTQERRDQLRKTLSETISDIGSCDITVVEEILLQLAINKHIGVQAVAARAIGRWREYNEREKPLVLLRRWMDDREIADIVNYLALHDDDEQKEKPTIYLRSTIALAIGYAAQADPPNNMPQILYSLLEELSEDPNQHVRTYLSSYTLPMILPIHLKQVSYIVQTLALDITLHEQIANGMAQAYRKRPGEVAAILNRWYRWCLSPSARDLRGKRGERRTALLACVCVIYGRLPYQQNTGTLTVEAMLGWMRHVLEIERDSTVRKAALSSTIRQARDYLSELQDVVPQVTPEELREIINTLVEVYLEQREQQSGGETSVRVGARAYPVWVYRQRPLTPVEAEMYMWVKDDYNITAQQIAIRALLAFQHALYKAEQQRINEIFRQQARNRSTFTLNQRFTPEQNKIGLHVFDWYLYYVVSFIVTIRAKKYRSVIRGILPEILQQHDMVPKQLHTLFREWTDLTDQDIVELGVRLPKAIIWAHRKLWFQIALAIFIIIIVALCGLLFFVRK